MYATHEDIIARYGEDAFAVTYDRGGVVDYEAATQSLADASAEIDVYLSGRYSLPLSPVPAVLKLACIDLAYYRGSVNAGTVTDEKRKRYEDQVRLLERIADGRVKLGVEDPAQGTDGGATFSTSPRVMGRSQLRGGF